uniref:G_PROTEIN_RECEP_F1_2 domain-containing protein n=1 Tax=Panagrellus redivivus TaxID=6233 RepID=A0A7E4WAA5_PANRE
MATYEFVGSHRFDTSPTIDDNWTILCSDEQDAKIMKYDADKNNLADHVLPTLTLVLSIIAVLTNIVFIYFVFVGLRTKALPFKGYSLLLNRSITDFFVALLTSIFVGLRKFDQFNATAPDPHEHGKKINLTEYELDYLIPHGRTMFTLLLTVDFWAVAGAYGIMALLPFMLIKNPFFYRRYVTKKVIVITMIVSWLIGAIYSAIVVCLSSNNVFNLFNSANDLIQWTVNDEDYVLSISNLFIVTVAFAVGSFSYIFIIVYLYRYSAKIGGLAGAQLAQIVRMALNIGAFATTCIVMAGFVALPLFLRSHIDNLEELNHTDRCQAVVKIFELSYIMAIWTTVAMAGWMLRIILDPITNIALDIRFRKLLRSRTLIKLSNSVTFTPNKFSAPSFLSRSEFLRKCAERNVIPITLSHPQGHYFRFRSPSDMDPSDFAAPVKRKKLIHIRFDDLVI